MKYIFQAIILFTFFSCNNPKQQAIENAKIVTRKIDPTLDSLIKKYPNYTEKKTQRENIKSEKIKSDKVLKTEVDNESENNSDCVFDDNYKKITAEWLGEVGIKKYVWDSKINKATFIYNGDTLTVYKGGCYHFVSSVEIKTDLNKNKLLDSILLTKITDIACKFKFDNYCKKLSEGKFKKIDNSNSSYFLEFEDDDPEDNLISEGINILEKRNSTVIEISEYYN